ncbi:hypothetical protein RSOL_487300 [Rhizoctonia solani AG-3 Rhs1AP]|uniref:Uncharacterized protein n=1 Tax=Rhizoctonia solani AG-3 Rhs1AP TaxID=1086054 RepID=X8JJ70_9AGAM|nr:hypothetical protein RSOL_487300 [Rhizoctonia solani AG-3 Rhs1AP]
MPLNTLASSSSSSSRPRNESMAPQPSRTKLSSNSLTRRNSAPMIEKKPMRPILDTSRTYQRPGMSPIHKSTTPMKLSTFGTPYNASWESSTSTPRPATAPLPDDDDDLVGGVHYTTYGSRTSQVYEAPFSDISIPVPQELRAQAENEIARSEKEKEKGHKRSGSALLRMVGVEPATPDVEPSRPRRLTLNSMNAISHQPSQHSMHSGTDSTRGTTSAEDTTLISMSRFPLPPDGGTPRTIGTPTIGTPTIATTPTVARPTTPGSMITIHPNTPSTPAIPDFLAASRTNPDESSARSTPDDSRPSSAAGIDNDPSRPKLRTRGSLLALAMSAAAMVGVDVDETANRPIETPKTERAFDFSFPLPEHTRATSPLLNPSDPRRRSLLERLTSRITTPVPDTIQDVTWASVSSDWTDAEDTRQLRPGPVLDFDLAPEEPLMDMEQFGLLDTTWSPTRQQQQSATFPPMASTPRTVFPTSGDPLVSDDSISPTRPRARTLSKLSTAGRHALGRASTRRSRRRTHGRADSIPTRMREGGRLESLTRRQSADALSAEGTIEGTVLYGVGEEMLRLMFAGGAASSTEGSEEKDQLLPHVIPSQDLEEELERERTRSLPRPRAHLVASPTEEEPRAYPPVMPLNIRPKGHRRGTTSKENASSDKVRDSKPRPLPDRKTRPSFEHKARPLSDYKPRPIKSRSRSKSTPLGISQRHSVEVVGILTNGNNSGRTTPNHTLGRGAGRVVIVNSATIPGTPTRKAVRSNPMPPSDTETSQPGVIVTAPTPPAPRRSLSMPLESVPAERPESPKGTVSRGTSVQFVPESFEGRRRGRNRKESANTLVPPVPEAGKGKRKVEREPTDASDTSAKKPRLSVEDMDITFMGEPLFDGRPQHRRGGFGSQASSHPSTYSRHSQSYSRNSQSYSRHSQSYYPYPSPTSSPDPERATIPMHAIFTPRVQSLYGTGAKPDYASHRPSISSIPRPKSRASARSNATGARSTKTHDSLRGPQRWHDTLPVQGWCFLVGFLVPFVWWYAAFARAERGYFGGGVWRKDVESQWEGVRTDVHRDDGRVVVPKGLSGYPANSWFGSSSVVDAQIFYGSPRNYRWVVENSARLHLQIELGANGLQLPRRWLAAGGHSQELLENLVQCREDWLDLRLTNGRSLPRTTSGQRFTLWELRRGVFASAFSIGEHRQLEADALKIITLDSPVYEWTLTFDTTFHELTIDPAQDLLVLAVTRSTMTHDSSLHPAGPRSHYLDISLRSLQTGLAHPSAKLGVLSFSVQYSLIPHHIYSTVSLSITNDILLVSLIANSSELHSSVMVLDWKAGVVLMHTGWRPGLRSAILLHDDCLLVFEACVSNTNDIGEAMTGRLESLELFVYDAIRTPEAYEHDSLAHPLNQVPHKLCEETMRFQFPEFLWDVWILATDFLVRAAPVSDLALHHTPDFIPDHTCRILSLSMRIISGESQVNLLVFIDSGMLLAHLKTAKAAGQKSVPWPTWGEYSTRWIRYMSEPNPWINWLQGTRYVLGRQVIDAQNDADDCNYIAIADFHLPTIRRFASRTKEHYLLPLPEHELTRREAIGSGQWAYFGNYSNRKLEAGALAVDIVDADTPTVLHGLSLNPIISRLPYRLVVARPNASVRGWSDWMIDDNRIIGIGPNPVTGQFGDFITIQTLRSGSHATQYDPAASSVVVETAHT